MANDDEKKKEKNISLLCPLYKYILYLAPKMAILFKARDYKRKVSSPTKGRYQAKVYIITLLFIPQVLIHNTSRGTQVEFRVNVR